MSPALAGGFLTTVPPGKSHSYSIFKIKFLFWNFPELFIQIFDSKGEKINLQL